MLQTGRLANEHTAQGVETHGLAHWSSITVAHFTAAVPSQESSTCRLIGPGRLASSPYSFVSVQVCAYDVDTASYFPLLTSDTTTVSFSPSDTTTVSFTAPAVIADPVTTPDVTADPITTPDVPADSVTTPDVPFDPLTVSISPHSVPEHSQVSGAVARVRFQSLIVPTQCSFVHP